MDHTVLNSEKVETFLDSNSIEKINPDITSMQILIGQLHLSQWLWKTVALTRKVKEAHKIQSTNSTFRYVP